MYLSRVLVGSILLLVVAVVLLDPSSLMAITSRSIDPYVALTSEEETKPPPPPRQPKRAANHTASQGDGTPGSVRHELPPSPDGTPGPTHTSVSLSWKWHRRHHSPTPEANQQGEVNTQSTQPHQQRTNDVNITRSDKVVLIVENHMNNKIGFSVRNALTNLPHEWIVQIFHSPQMTEGLKQMAELEPYFHQGRIILTPTLDEHMSKDGYSALCLSLDFWKQVQGETVLLVQCDSVICGNSPHKIDEFLQYDYVGAPWIWHPELLGGNGGFSLRKKSVMMRTIEQCGMPPIVEDLWFARCFDKLIKRGVAINLPPRSVSMRFSVESIYFDKPFGLHQPWTNLGSQLNSWVDYCPEMKEVVPEHAWPKADQALPVPQRELPNIDRYVPVRGWKRPKSERVEPVPQKEEQQNDAGVTAADQDWWKGAAVRPAPGFQAILSHFGSRRRKGGGRGGGR